MLKERKRRPKKNRVQIKDVQVSLKNSVRRFVCKKKRRKRKIILATYR